MSEEITMIIEEVSFAQLIESVGGIGALASIIGCIAAVISVFVTVIHNLKQSKSIEEQVRARGTDKFRVIIEKVLVPLISQLEYDLTRLISGRDFSIVNVLKNSPDEFKNIYYIFKTEFDDLAKLVEVYGENCNEMNYLLEDIEQSASDNKNFLEDVKRVIVTYLSYDEWIKENNFREDFERLFTPTGTHRSKWLIRHIL